MKGLSRTYTCIRSHEGLLLVFCILWVLTNVECHRAIITESSKGSHCLKTPYSFLPHPNPLATRVDLFAVSIVLLFQNIIVRNLKIYNFCWLLNVISLVQPLSRVRLFATPWTAARQAFLSTISFWSLLKLMSIECNREFKILSDSL